MSQYLEGLELKLAAGTLRVVSVILVFLLGRWAIRLLIRMFDRVLDKNARLESGVRNFLKVSVSTALYVLLAATILTWIGIPGASIAAALVSAGMAVGLALQGSLSNLAGGIVILFTRPFVTGDYIVSEGGEGFVTEIGLVYTKIRMFDNRVISIPNSALAAAQVTNMTALPDRRIDIEVGIGYASDIDRAREVILDYILAQPEIWTEKPPAVAVTGLHDSSVGLKAMAWVRNMDYGTQCGLKASMTEGIKKELDRNGIEIPFPQMDLHIKKD